MNEQNHPVDTGCPPSVSAPIYQKNDYQPPAQQAPARPAPPPVSLLDGIFSLVFLAVGWCYYELILSYQPSFFFHSCYLGTFLFTVLFAAAVLAYLVCSGRRPARESWFWLAILLCLGLSTALPYYGLSILPIFQNLALHLTAAYWVVCAFGQLIQEKRTSNWLLLDLTEAGVVLPFGNFFALPTVLFRWLASGIRRWTSRPKRQTGKSKNPLPAILLGILLAALCLCLVLPLLFAADSGFAELFRGLFSDLADWIAVFFRNFHLFSWLGEFFLQSFFAVPVALYLYGLLFGCAHDRFTKSCKKEPVQAFQSSIRITPQLTVSVALGSLCAVYLIFIAMQANYLFGAFWGALPAGFSYSEYARSGFFELCRIAAINLGILLAANSISRTPCAENKPLRICNLLVAVLTLLLLATAAAKMGLYISVYGLTVKRVVASVFLVWIAVVFLCVLLQQFFSLPTLRISVFLGAVLFTLLCLLPVADGVDAYNDHFGYTEDPVLSTYAEDPSLSPYVEQVQWL